MSIWGSIGSAILGVGKQVLGAAVGGAIGGPVGAAIGGALAGGIGGGGGGGGGGNLPALPGGAPRLPALPMRTRVGRVGRVALAAGAGAAVDHYVDSSGNVVAVRRKRRRRKGISGHDLQSFKRVARLIDKFAAPVHHLRKSSFKRKE